MQTSELTYLITRNHPIFDDRRFCTNNSSESFNHCVKQYIINWDSAPVDTITLAFFLFQCELIDEFELAYKNIRADGTGTGNYQQKNEKRFKKNVINTKRNYKHVNKDDLIVMIRSGTKFPNKNIEKSKGYRMTATAIALIAIQEGKVNHNVQNAYFTVTNSFDEKPFNFKIVRDKEMEYTCKANALCFHRIAVLLSTFGECPHPEDDDYDYNLSVILKKPRKERKPKSIKVKDIKLGLERVGNNLSLQTLDWTALNVKTSTPNISRKDHSSDSEDEDLREVKSMENPSHDRIQENMTEIELEKIRDSVKQLFSEKGKVVTGKKEGYIIIYGQKILSILMILM